MHKVTNCRLCGTSLSEQSVFFQDQYVSDFVTKDNVTAGMKVPIDLCVCPGCSLVQQRWSAPQDFLYSLQYWYRSGVTDTMTAQLKDIVASCIEEVSVTPSDVFLDIGANDGTMLSHVEGMKTVGIDPASNLFDSLNSNVDIASNDFWSADVYDELRAKHDLPLAKVITAIGMFYDLEDPLKFVSDITRVLDDDGIFVAQLLTLEPMLETNDLGNLCHEHLEFYTYESLVYLFEKAGLEIYQVTENKTNGGSYRIFARKYQKGSIQYGTRVGIKEVQAFKDRVDEIGTHLKRIIAEAIADNKTIHVLGASTKGNFILQYYELDSSFISMASERSEEKFGRFTVGTGIKIVSEEESRIAEPDYYLILPWAFTQEMISREAEHAKRGGKFIVPFPELRIL